MNMKLWWEVTFLGEEKALWISLYKDLQSLLALCKHPSCTLKISTAKW